MTADDAMRAMERRYYDLYGSNIQSAATDLMLAEMERLRKRLVKVERAKEEAEASVAPPDWLPELATIQPTVYPWKYVPRAKVVNEWEIVLAPCCETVKIQLRLGPHHRLYGVDQCSKCLRVYWTRVEYGR